MARASRFGPCRHAAQANLISDWHAQLHPLAWDSTKLSKGMHDCQAAGAPHLQCQSRSCALCQWGRASVAAPGLWQVWYDNPRSLAAKYRLAAELGLRGVGVWNLDLLDYADAAGSAAQQQTRDMWAALRAFTAPGAAAAPHPAAIALP